MFEVDGKNYELKYNMKTIERIENSTGKPMVATIQKNDGLLSLTDLKLYFGLALFNEDGKRMGQQQAFEIAESLMRAEGYQEVVNSVIVAIDRDCPFLFQVG